MVELRIRNKSFQVIYDHETKRKSFTDSKEAFDFYAAEAQKEETEELEFMKGKLLPDKLNEEYLSDMREEEEE